MSGCVYLSVCLYIEIRTVDIRCIKRVNFKVRDLRVLCV